MTLLNPETIRKFPPPTDEEEDPPMEPQQEILENLKWLQEGGMTPDDILQIAESLPPASDEIREAPSIKPDPRLTQGDPRGK